MKEKSKKPARPYKAARVITLVLIILLAIVIALFVLTFGTMFMVGGKFLTEGDRILTLFLIPLSQGERPIKDVYMNMAVAPGVVGLTFFMIYVIILRRFFVKAGKENTFYFKKGGAYFAAMTVISALWSFVPRILSEVFASQVAKSGYFEIRQWNPVPYIILTVLTLVLTLIYRRKKNNKIKTEANEGDSI